MSIYDSDLNKTFGPERKEVITDDIVQAIKSYVSEFSKLGVHERVERIDRIANEVLIPFDEKYSQVGDYIIEHSEQLVREANQEYEFHVKLIENWDRLIQRAKEIDLRKVADSNSVANT
jgi:Na+/phosphate symporter